MDRPFQAFQRLCQAAKPRLDASGPPLDAALALSLLDRVPASEAVAWIEEVLFSGNPALAAAMEKRLCAMGAEAKDTKVGMSWYGRACKEAGRLLQLCAKESDLSWLLGSLIVLMDTPTPAQHKMAALHSIALLEGDWTPMQPALARVLIHVRCSQRYGMYDPEVSQAVDARIDAAVPHSVWLDTIGTTWGTPTAREVAGLWMVVGTPRLAQMMHSMGNLSSHEVLAAIARLPDRAHLHGIHSSDVVRAMQGFFEALPIPPCHEPT